MPISFFTWNIGILQSCFENELLDIPNLKGNASVNYTDGENTWTRIIEHKWSEFGKDDGDDFPKTVIRCEFSSERKLGDEPYYHVKDKKSSVLYAKYKNLQKKTKVIFGGRLGEYKYYDMVAVIDSALKMAGKLILEEIVVGIKILKNVNKFV